MKGIWRWLVLIVLPGSLWGGWTINGFFRLLDAPGTEPLLFLTLGLAGWCGVFALAVRWTLLQSHPEKNTSVNLWSMVALFLLLPGTLRLSGIYGCPEGIALLLVSAISAGRLLGTGAMQLLNSTERIMLVLGIGSSWLVWMLADLWQELHLLEPFYFCLSELMLILWLFASPGTVYGTFRGRWMQRTVLALLIVAGWFVSPELFFMPWNPPPETIAEANFQSSNTIITHWGSRFQWGDESGKTLDFAITAPDGRIIHCYDDYQPLNAAIPVFRGIYPEQDPAVRFAGSCNSPWLKNWLEFFPESKITVLSTPDTLRFPLEIPSGNQQDSRETAPCDLLVIHGLPDWQYDAYLENWLKRLTSSPIGIAVISGTLLRHPAVFTFFHERFIWHDVLPGQGGVWLFSNSPPELPWKNPKTEQWKPWPNVQELPLLQTMLITGIHAGNGDPAITAVPDGNGWRAALCPGRWNHWGSYLGIVLGVLLWKIIRTFQERRSNAHQIGNLLENGFLLQLSLGIAFWICCGMQGISAVEMLALFLWCAIALLPGNQVWRGYWKLQLLWLLVLPCFAEWGQSVGNLGLSMIGSVLFWRAAGLQLRADCTSVADFRNRLAAFASGMMLGALMLGIGLFFRLPLDCLVALAIIMHLSGILQNRHPRVY